LFAFPGIVWYGTINNAGQEPIVKPEARTFCKWKELTFGD
jgi:hypothetical protein